MIIKYYEHANICQIMLFQSDNLKNLTLILDYKKLEIFRSDISKKI